MSSWHFWQKWFVSYLCLLTDGYVNTTGYRRLSLLTGLRANWNTGSWAGWFTIDCLFPLPNNSPLMYMASTAHEMNTNIPLPSPPRSFFTVVFLFSTRAQQASAATSKIPWLPTLTVNRQFTHTLCYSHLGYDLTGELGCERVTKRQTASRWPVLARPHLLKRRNDIPTSWSDCK